MFNHLYIRVSQNLDCFLACLLLISYFSQPYYFWISHVMAVLFEHLLDFFHYAKNVLCCRCKNVLRHEVAVGRVLCHFRIFVVFAFWNGIAWIFKGRIFTKILLNEIWLGESWDCVPASLR